MSLKIEKLSLRLGDKWVLRDVSFEAAKGSIVGVCGHNGAGKSMLLRAIAGKAKGVTGRINITPSAVIFHDGLPKSSILSSFFEKNCSSHGEFQSESFLQTIEHAGDVLLLDDPFSSLDHNGQRQCFERLRAWAAGGGTALIADSDFARLVSVTDQIFILSKGDFKQMGMAKEIYEHPSCIESACLSGEINLIEARRISSSDAGHPEFQTIIGSHRIVTGNIDKRRLGPINKNTTLAIRPEQISMSVGASFPEDNLLRAEVTGIEFKGSTSLISFDAGGLILKTRVFKVVGLNVGDECMLGLPTDRILSL